MKTALNFIRGSIATKELVPILTHVHFSGERIQAFNGVTCVSYPFETDFDAAVPAKQFIKAVDICEGSPDIVSDGKSILVRRGSFKCKLPVEAETDFPEQDVTSGTRVDCPEDFLAVMVKLRGFVSEDASRPWSNGVKVMQGMAYATNNVTLVRHPLNVADVVLSIQLIDEMIRVRLQPEHLIVGDHEVTAVYDKGWIKGRIQTGEWPDVVTMLAEAAEGVAVPAGLYEAVVQVSSFSADGVVSFLGSQVSAGGAEVTMDAEFEAVAFQTVPLTTVLNVAEFFELTPTVTKFRGKGVVGMMANVQV